MGLFKKKEEIPQQQEPATPSVLSDHELSELVIKSIREGVLIVGADYNIKLVNPMASIMLGRNVEELIGLYFDSGINLIDKSGNRLTENFNPILNTIKTGEVAERRDLDLLTVGSNKTTPISLIVTPTGGAGSSVVVTFRDIAKELEEERERTDFISTASHEMRTPVASIEGYLGLAMNPATATVDERAQMYLAKAHESSRHLGRLFQDLLDTTKLEDGKIKTRMEPVEIVSVVKEFADAQVPNIQEKGLQYQFGSNNTTGQAGGVNIAQVIYASIDRDFLQEVINNLIENAIKYTPAGWITVNVKADDYNVQVIIEDTGIGIPRDETEHIFQKFYRVDNSDTREIGGTGLGLALVKQRVEMMGGKIWVESQQGKGSRFITMFPRLSKEIYDQQRFLFENQQKMQTVSKSHEQAVQAFMSGSAPVSAPAPSESIATAAATVAAPQVAPAAPVAPAPTPVAPAPQPAPAPASATPAPQPAAPVAPAPAPAPAQTPAQNAPTA
ncbi:MAG: PAS domain-containing sensor histidine kinase [Candidatus Saccharibacteria bacterium]|nr:PAS domain-containing sensor histidine kinase [Candidatus Saccharibacteria bacterium]